MDELGNASLGLEIKICIKSQNKCHNKFGVPEVEFV